MAWSVGFVGVFLVPVSCHLRILLARLNVERAKRGQATVSLRHLANDSGVSLSVVAALHTGRSQRVDFATLDRLLTYFSCALNVSVNDLLVWEPAPVAEEPPGVPYAAV